MGKGKERLRGSLGPGLRVVESHQRVVVDSLRLVGGGLGRRAAREVEGSGQGGRGRGLCSYI